MIQIYGWLGDKFFATQARGKEAGGIITGYRVRGWTVFWRRVS